MSQHDEFSDALIEGLDGWGIEPDQIQMERLRAHYLAMVETNRTMNLTRIVEPTEAALKHYVDSLALLSCVESMDLLGLGDCCRLLDVGTGAGFPAIPLAVMRPSWEITAIDSTGKKIKFVKRVAADMGLANLSAIHARAEHWRPREHFDIVALRAVAKTAKCLSQTAHLVAPNGLLVIYKIGSVGEEDTVEAKNVGDILTRQGCGTDEPPSRSAQREIPSRQESHPHPSPRAKGAPMPNLTPMKPFNYELEIGGTPLKRSLHIFARKR